mmetsp:Transcript_82692/g.167645  ORF Transcript_82692/g.167645 Transcript_82692/m.167645 type:complete len:351 (-) Transcript_82692:28-1080(-)
MASESAHPSRLAQSRRSSALDGVNIGPELKDSVAALSTQLMMRCARIVWPDMADEEEGKQKVARIWEAAAIAIMKDLKAGLSVAIDTFGLFEFKHDPEIIEDPVAAVHHERCCALVLSPTFALLYGLSSHDIYSTHPGPQVRLSPVSSARAAEVSKDTVQRVLDTMFVVLGEAMSLADNLIMSFAPLGHIYCEDKVVSFEPIHPPSLWDPFSQLTVREMLLERRELHRQREARQHDAEVTRSHDEEASLLRGHGSITFSISPTVTPRRLHFGAIPASRSFGTWPSQSKEATQLLRLGEALIQAPTVAADTAWKFQDPDACTARRSAAALVAHKQRSERVRAQPLASGVLP